MNYAAEQLDEVMAPLRPWLDDPATEDIAMQEPGVAWIYQRGRWRREEVPIDDDAIWDIAKLSGSLHRRDIDDSKPLLDVKLPGGERFFAAVPSAIEPDKKAVWTLRKPDLTLPLFEEAPTRYKTEGWNKWKRYRAGRDLSALLEIFDRGVLWEFLPAAVKAKLNILFVGATGAGKTTMSKLAGTAMEPDERVITIEDAVELVLRQPNNVRFIYPSDGQGPVTVQSLQEGALRSRPDRILIQEIRQPEVAAVYVRRNGHQGTLATIHGSDAATGLQHLFQLYMSSEAGRGQDVKTAADMLDAIDVIIPLERIEDEKRVLVGSVWFVADAERRDGETAADLLR